MGREGGHLLVSYLAPAKGQERIALPIIVIVQVLATQRETIDSLTLLKTSSTTAKGFGFCQ